MPEHLLNTLRVSRCPSSEGSARKVLHATLAGKPMNNRSVLPALVASVFLGYGLSEAHAGLSYQRVAQFAQLVDKTNKAPSSDNAAEANESVGAITDTERTARQQSCAGACKATSRKTAYVPRPVRKSAKRVQRDSRLAPPSMDPSFRPGFLAMAGIAR